MTRYAQVHLYTNEANNLKLLSSSLNEGSHILMIQKANFTNTGKISILLLHCMQQITFKETHPIFNWYVLDRKVQLHPFVEEQCHSTEGDS